MMVSCIGDKRSRLIFPINVSFGTDWQLSLHKSILNLCIDNEKLNIYIVVSPSQHTTASLAILDDDIAKIAAITIGVFSCCDDASITQLDAECASNDTDVLIALGGGNVIDLCKLVSLRREVYLIAVPSILSSDCVSSPIAVKKEKSGFRNSIPASTPHEIIIDVKLLSAAPDRFMKAGIGDLCSNFSALKDVDASLQSGASVNYFAYLLSETAIMRFASLFELSHVNIEDVNMELAKGLILSGMAMGFAGNSSPCSGSEHLISHAMDYYLGGRALHGEQVGLATLYVNSLRNLLNMPVLPESVLTILKDFCGYSNPEKFNISRQEFLHCVRMSSSVRKNRLPFWANLEISDLLLAESYDKAFYQK